MKLGRFRQFADETYIVPVEKLELFDKLSEQLEGAEYLDCPHLFEEFTDKFGEHEVEGDIVDYDVILEHDKRPELVDDVPMLDIPERCSNWRCIQVEARVRADDGYWKCENCHASYGSVE